MIARCFKTKSESYIFQYGEMAHDVILSSVNPLFKIYNFMKKTPRVQYGCVEVSSDFICIGASTGTTYMFDRQTSELKLFITNKVSPVTHLKFSSDGKILAVVDRSGFITCWEIPPVSGDHSNQDVKVFREIKELTGEKISALCWYENSRLFIGTHSGIVVSFNVGSNAFLSKLETIYKSGDPIVQLDISCDKLLVSVTTKALVYSLDLGQFHQIGKKARDGIYGCCFLNALDGSEVIIYSARPGCRLWEVNSAGQVLATHQFKELLNIPPTPIITSSAVKLPNCSAASSQSFNFPYLQQIMNKYLLTWSVNGIYLFEPCKRKVFAWNDQVKDIISVASFNSSIYILHSNCIITEIQLLSTKLFLKTFFDLQEWQKVAEVAIKCKEEILMSVESFLSIDFYEVLNQLQTEKQGLLQDEFRKFVEDFEKRHAQVCAEIQEKMNRNDATSPIGDVEDYDDIQSNKSSEGSSRISLSRFITLDSFMEKATNKLVKKVVNSGFMKKALYEALEAEGVHLDKSLNKNYQKTKSVPTSPTQSRSNTASNSSTKSEENIPKEMHIKLPEHHSMPNIFSAGTEIVHTQKNIDHNRPRNQRKKRPKIIDVANLPATEPSKDFEQIRSTTDCTDSSSAENTSSDPLSSESFDGAFNSSGSNNESLILFHSENGNEADFNFLTLPHNSLQIINKLLSITANTSNNFRDTKILYNSNIVKKVLTSWSKELASVTMEFQEEVFKMVDQKIKDAMSHIILSFIDIQSRFLLFKQLSAGYSEISNVAMLCLETNIFPQKCQTLQIYEFALLNFLMDFDTMQKNIQLETKIILNREDDRAQTKNLSKESFDLLDDSSTNNGAYESLCLRMLVSSGNDSAFEKECFFGETKELKKNLCESFLCDDMMDCASCIIDKCRACFILRYFPILNFERMYSLLLWKGGCRWRSWCACMVHLKELYKQSNLSKSITKNNVNADVVLKSSAEDFLGNVSRLHMISPHLIPLYIEQRHLTNWEVSLLYNTGYINEASHEFLLYSESIFCSSNIPKLHPLFLLCSLENSLSSQPLKLDLFCKCGKPRPRSNSIEWKHQKILLPLFCYLDQLKKDQINRSLLQSMSKLCLKNGYWNGYIKLLVWLNNLNDAINLLVQLQDEEIFMYIVKDGCLNLTTELWSFLLSEYSKQAKSESHKCKPLNGCCTTLNLDKVIRKAACTVGSSTVLQIIKKFSIDVPINLYTSLLQALNFENQQKIVIEKLLQLASSRVWSDKRNIVHSQLENIKNKELLGIKSDFNGIFNADLIIDESDSMWGRNINLTDSTCPVCTLPLSIKTSSTVNGGLLLFPCGHIFHKVCLPELACLICFCDHFTSLG